MLLGGAQSNRRCVLHLPSTILRAIEQSYPFHVTYIFVESKNCNSNIWRFLSTILICKSHAVLHKVERAKEILDEALVVANSLNSPALVGFVENCRVMNEAELSLKKRTQSMESVRRRKSKISLESRNSQLSQQSNETNGSSNDAA